MKKNISMTEEFIDFLSAPEVNPDPQVLNKILAYVREDLNPSRSRVFMKILGIHAVVSTFSLSLCSQFGIQTFPLYDAMNDFMKVMGHSYCLALCGFLYLAVSAVAFSFSLRLPEIQLIRKDKYVQLLMIIGVSLGVFLCFGEGVLTLPAVFWMGGAIFGGMGAFEVGWKIRMKVRNIVFANI